jgi:DNA-binding LytR/AlgR family response regulator
MRILIVEDEPQAAERLVFLLTQTLPQAEVVARLDTVKRSVAWLQSQISPELIFMDIQLADGLSFEIFEQVTVKSPVIFTTAYNEYALKAFKVNSIDYLLKPIDAEELQVALTKWKGLTAPITAPDKMMESIAYAMQMLTKKYKERFVLKVGEHLRTVEVEDVLFFYSQEKTTFAHTKDSRKSILDFTLDQLEELLDPRSFFRINRKYIIAISALQDMIHHTNSRLKVKLKGSDDSDIIVARERVQDFKDWLDR